MSNHTALKERLPADDAHDLALQVQEQMKQDHKQELEKQKQERDEERARIAKSIHYTIKNNLIPGFAQRGKMEIKIYLVRRREGGSPGFHPSVVDNVLWGCGDYDFKTIQLLRKKFNKDGFSFTWDYARKYVYNSFDYDDCVITVSWKKSKCIIM